MAALQQFIKLVHAEFEKAHKITVRDIRKFADIVGLPQDDKNLWEVTEVAWVMWYRQLIASAGSSAEAFRKVVFFYDQIQPTFSSRDSTRKIFQQYSTSAPIAWLAGWFTDTGKEKPAVFEPSAGNGLLTIHYQPLQVDVNEIDATRLANLRLQGFNALTTQDASQPFPANRRHHYDAILTNPPFGTLDEVNRDYGWGFRKLDHVMVAHALETMRDDGRASIIIGGHTEFDEKNNVIKSGRSFFDWLFRHYRVVDMINIDSPKLYSKQGTTFPLRMILVAGRKAEPHGFSPSRRDFPEYAEVVSDFTALYERTERARHLADQPEITLTDLLNIEQEKIKMELS